MKTLDIQEIKHLFELFGTGENGIKEFKDTLNKVKTLPEDKQEAYFKEVENWRPRGYPDLVLLVAYNGGFGCAQHTDILKKVGLE